MPGGYGAPQFLAAMYAAGAPQDMDGLGVHVYPSDYAGGLPATWDPAVMQQWLSQLTPVRSASGAASQPLWITEMGISTSSEAGWPTAATQAQQAADPVAMDDPDNAINIGWGIFSADGAAKPAACAVSQQFHGTLAC